MRAKSNNKIQEGETSLFNTSLSILEHLNRLLFEADLLSVNTDKHSTYRRWRILQIVDRSITPYAKKEERDALQKGRNINFPPVKGYEWVRSGAEAQTRSRLNTYEDTIREVMARAGFHITEKDTLHPADVLREDS